MRSGTRVESYVFKLEPGMLQRILDIGYNPTLPLALLSAMALYVIQPGGFPEATYLLLSGIILAVAFLVFAHDRLHGQVAHAVITSGMILVKPIASWSRRISPERVKRVVVRGTSTGESIDIKQTPTGQLLVDPLMPQRYFVVELTTDDNSSYRFSASPTHIDFVVNALQYGGCAFLPETRGASKRTGISKPGPA